MRRNWKKCHTKTSINIYANFTPKRETKNGENYSRSTLLSLRNGIERFLNSPPLNKGVRITQDARFVLSNKMLDAKIKQLKKENQQSTNHKPPIDKEDLQKLKTSSVLLPDGPLSLLRNVWFHTTLFWCRRGREGQRSLTKNSFTFESDSSGAPYVTMAHDEKTKNHQGGLQDDESFERYGRMYKGTGPTDGYTCLELYLHKLSPKCDALFQYPKRNWSGILESCWYENRPLGVNKLSTMMKDISAAAELSKIYINHSVRASAITLWSQAGLSNRQIMAISGHRNETSLRSYNNQHSTSQLRQCSNVLAHALGDLNASTDQSQESRSQNQLSTTFALPCRERLHKLQALK